MHKTNSHFFIFILLIISYEIIHNESCDENRCSCSDSICISCKSGYYFLRDKNDNKCYTKEEGKAQGFYIYTGRNIMEKCHNNCITCEDGIHYPTDEDQKCIKCKEGLYKIGNNRVNCYEPIKININYYKDISENPPIFKPCYYKCNTCSELGNDENNKCDSCRGGISSSQYYKLDSEEAGNCYLINEIPENYQIPLIEELNVLATRKINLRNGISSEGKDWVYIFEKIAIKCHKN